MTKIFKKASLLLLLFLTTIFAMSNIIVISARALKYNDYDFSTISADESIKFVEYHNIHIPKKIEKSPSLGEITSDIIKKVANDADYLFIYNYDEMQLYAENIKKLVSSYSNHGTTLLSTNSYTLQNSTVKDSKGNWVTSGGAWDPKWKKYNCYAYSIKRNENSPFYDTDTQYQPGDMSKAGWFGTCNEITDLVDIVIKDLEKMGYTNISSTLSIPSITDEQELICVRMCKDDYHFMRYDIETDTWYHKPGPSAILKYNYIPSNDYIWSNECSVNGVEIAPRIYYDSDIYFIKYDKNKVDTSSSISNISYKLYVNAGKDSILEIDNSSYNQYYKINVTSTNSVKAELYDENMELLETYKGSNIQIYTAFLNSDYYLKLNYASSSASGNINISISTHTHSYTYEPAESSHNATCTVCGYKTTSSHVYDQHYCIYCNVYTSMHDYDRNFEWISYTMHSAQCCCGEVGTQGHVVASGSYNAGQRYAKCLLCGGLADIGFAELNSNSSAITKVTVNGSFILPNGVIILEAADLEAYLNGTLVFYDKDQVSVIQ